MMKINKNQGLRVLLALTLILQAGAGPLYAQYTVLETAVPGTVPTGMNYQGRLEKDGFPVTGTNEMIFTLFDTATGGVALWNSGTLNVTVTQGVFSALLSIPTTALNGTAQRYLEVSVDGITLAPRDPIRTVPYAAIAETVEGDIDISTAGLNFNVNAIAALVISSITGNVGVGTADPGAQLTVVPKAADNIIVNISSQNASAIMVVNTQGRLGLGTDTPLKLMDLRSVDEAVIRLHSDTDNNSANADAGIHLINNAATQTGQLIFDDSSGVLALGNAANNVVTIAAANAAGNVVNIAANGKLGINKIDPGNDLTLRPLSAGEGFALRTFGDGSDAVKLSANASEGLLEMYEGGTSRVQLSPDTGGTPTFFNAGNVGIKTNTPLADFDVNGAAQFGAGGNKSTFTATGSLLLDDGALLGVRTSAPQTTLEVEGTASFGAGANKSTFTAVGSLLLDDGARLGVGTNVPQMRAHILNGGTAATPAAQADAFLRVQNSAAAGNNAIVEVITGTSGTGKLCFGDTGAACQGSLQYAHAGDRLDLGSAGTATRVSITSTGDLGIGTTAPGSTLDVIGNAQFGSGVAKSSFTTGGVLNMGTNLDINMVGGGEVLGLPATPSASGASSKEYVDAQIGGISFWSRDGVNGELFPSLITDQLGIGTGDPSARFHALENGTATSNQSADAAAVFQKSLLAATNAAVDIVSGNIGTATLFLGDTDSATQGSVQYNNNTGTLGLGTNGAINRLTISNTGAVTVNGTLTANTIDTGQGATEVHLMNQNLRTTDSPTFGTVTAALSGNATTATALAANGANCGAGNAPLGVNQAGAVEGCFDVATQGELNTHAALTGTSAHSAASANTASAIVARDGSGNFAAGTITMTGITFSPAKSGMTCGDVPVAITVTGDTTCALTTQSCMAVADYGANSIISCATGSPDATHTARCCRVQ